MNDLTDNDLWNKIAGFDFDDPQAEAPFSVRLARENGWTPERTKAAIDQYRRFIYMVCISDDMLSPSPDVDKVWHLHLIYTKDYWKRFCDETLGQEVHHFPNRGADESQGPLREAYARTLELLTEEFGETPDAALWPGVDAARPLVAGALGLGSAVLPAAEITFGIALALIVITVSLLWSTGLIGGALAVGLCVVGVIGSISLLPEKRRRRRSKAGDSGCGGGASAGDGDGGGCGGGD